MGLAQRIAEEFPWGPQLATTVIATVVVAQLVGPLLFKGAIVRVGEARAHGGVLEGDASVPLQAKRPGPRSGVIVCVEGVVWHGGKGREENGGE